MNLEGLSTLRDIANKYEKDYETVKRQANRKRVYPTLKIGTTQFFDQEKVEIIMKDNRKKESKDK